MAVCAVVAVALGNAGRAIAVAGRCWDPGCRTFAVPRIATAVMFFIGGCAIAVAPFAGSNVAVSDDIGFPQYL